MRALAITSTLVTVLFVAAVGWFILQPDPLGGEPYALVDIDAARPEAPGRAAVRDLRPTIPAQTDERHAAIPAQRPDAPQPQDAVRVVAPEDVELPPVPVDALVEESRYGPLPKIAADGRRPSTVYARPSPVPAQPKQGEPARVAILISGLGLSEEITTEAIRKLPGAVTLAFGAYGRNLQNWIRNSREAGHEVMLQIPMEPFDYPDNDPGPQTLLTSLSPEENHKRLLWLLARFTGYTGVTNHMGAKFSAAQDAFLPVLEELRSRGLIYVDDGTSARSTAGSIARDLGLGFSVAQVQIDADKTTEGIAKALERLAGIALENGYAIGVGTALPATIDRVAEWTAALKQKGIVLIPVSAAVIAQHQSG